ncbi:MAG: FG-GAP repeat protein [Bacteroidetes bacterium]|nr:FG-GAP repeat protein [Bacteroidota bacterium]MBU1798129.1 FG-GAP repeat protein [Bacteroidota bacterium]
MKKISLKKILIFFFISINYLFAQDSLYLVTSFTGKNIDNKLLGLLNMGDLNGDGFDEIGIKKKNTNYFDIFFGNEIFNNNNNIRFFTHKQLKGDAGVNRVGDVNGDGYDDFITSGFRDTSFISGKVFLYFGGDPLDSIPDFSFEDIYIQDLLSAGNGGDINGDGYNDFVVVNPYNWSNGIGKVYLFLGGETIVDTPSVNFASEKLGDFFGYIADLEGDINGDGFNDLLVTAPYLAGAIDSTSNPKCYLYFGNTTIQSTFDFSFSIGFSENIRIIGDGNNDGFDDFITSEGTSNPKLYFGSEDFSTSKYLEFSAYSDIDNFGVGFSGIGDINNDGFDDFAINIKNFINDQNIMVSKLNIYLGGSVIDTIPDFSLEGETKWAEFGRIVGKCGDLNGDGYDEFYVLAPNYPDYENPLGKVYIYSMKKFLVSVEDGKSKLPQSFKLCHNYPNPFNPSTTINYQIPKNGFVNLVVYNTLAQEVAELVNEHQTSGKYSVLFNATGLSSGVYFYKIESGSFTKVNKMLLLR